MAIITREELLKIARMSQLSLADDQEIVQLQKDIQSILTYAERVREVSQDVDDISTKNINVFRQDVASNIDSQVILAQAPEREEDYFVVPRIIESK